MSEQDPECVFTRMWAIDTTEEPPDLFGLGELQEDADEATLEAAAAKEICPRDDCRLTCAHALGYVISAGDVRPLVVIGSTVPSDCGWHEIDHGLVYDVIVAQIKDAGSPS